MPPKKKSVKESKLEQFSDSEEVQTTEQSDQEKEVAEGGLSDEADSNNEASPKAGKKRKQPPTSSISSNKAARHSSETKSKSATILQYLLRPAALELCRPNDESKALAESKDKANLRTYSSSTLTPFEELLCAAVLSRPISHALGHRSIRTILNPPYNFTTPKSIREAGKEKCHEAMFDAHTQHKEKTAIEIAHIADVVAEKFGGEEDTSLEEVRKQTKRDVGKERELLRSSIKGVGPTGLDIFFRRVQWLWTEAFPFMDKRTKDAMAALGLPDKAGEMFEALERIWEDLDAGEVAGKDENERKRRAFVVVLERAVGAHLEKKSETVLEEAGKTELH